MKGEDKDKYSKRTKTRQRGSEKIFYRKGQREDKEKDKDKENQSSVAKRI